MMLADVRITDAYLASQIVGLFYPLVSYDTPRRGLSITRRQDKISGASLNGARVRNVKIV